MIGIDSIIFFCILAINIVYGLMFFNRLQKPYQVIVCMIITITINEIAAHYLLFSRENNLIVYHIFAPFHFAFLSCIYYLLARKGSFLRYLIVFSIPVIPVLSIINVMYWQDVNKNFPTNIVLLNSVFFLVYTLSYFLQMMNHVAKIPLIKQPLFWFNTANLLFFSVAFFYLGLQNILRGEMPDIFNKIMPFVNILTYIMYGISLYIAVRKPNHE